MVIDRRQILRRAAAALFTEELYSEESQSQSAVGSFIPDIDDPDRVLFAKARKRFLYPTDVTYGNTGT